VEREDKAVLRTIVFVPVYALQTLRGLVGGLVSWNAGDASRGSRAICGTPCSARTLGSPSHLHVVHQRVHRRCSCLEDCVAHQCEDGGVVGATSPPRSGFLFSVGL